MTATILLSVAGMALAGLCAAGALFRARSAIRDLWARMVQLERMLYQNRASSLQDKREIYGHMAAIKANLDRPVRFTSQHGEDILLMDLMHFRTHGVFVEIGAYDGVEMSNTWALEQLGWKGLLVEANPELVDRCRANRPGSTVVACAVAGPGAPATATFHVVTAPGIDAWSHLQGDPALDERVRARGGETHRVEVPCRPIQDILDQHGITRIDVLSIDVEGLEHDVLAGLDFTRTQPGVIIVEVNDVTEESGIAGLLRAWDYRLYRSIEVNRIYVRATAQP